MCVSYVTFQTFYVRFQTFYDRNQEACRFEPLAVVGHGVEVKEKRATHETI